MKPQATVLIQEIRHFMKEFRHFTACIPRKLEPYLIKDKDWRF
jgi:hypothetical protein